VQACSYHDDRPAVGICMRCRRPICAACSTRLDGVNHCFRCLKELGRRQAEPRPGKAAVSGLAATLLLLLVGCFFLFLECLFLIEGRLTP